VHTGAILTQSRHYGSLGRSEKVEIGLASLEDYWQQSSELGDDADQSLAFCRFQSTPKGMRGIDPAAICGSRRPQYMHLDVEADRPGLGDIGLKRVHHCRIATAALEDARKYSDTVIA
jgi:hypothetical protein